MRGEGVLAADIVADGSTHRPQDPKPLNQESLELMKPNKQVAAKKAEKLSFRKTPFRVLDKTELNEVKGGNGEMVIEMAF